jgi:hypothetical protein
MNILRNMGAVVVGLLPLVIACAPVATDEADEDVGVVQQAGGGGSNNGADSETAQECEVDILDAVDVRLTDPNNSSDMNPALPSSMLPEQECEEPLRYLYRCVGWANTMLPDYTSPAVTGAALMDIDTDWRTAGLTAAEEVDAFTCLTAHLNPNEDVSICLSGANVNGSDPDCDGFDVAEAVWLAERGPTGGILHTVWGLDARTLCDENWEESVRERVCGPTMSATTCGLVLRDDIETACDLENGYYECDGKPAIKTMLTTAGFGTLHPHCTD